MQGVLILLLPHSCVLLWSKQISPVKHRILPLTNKIKKVEGVQSRIWSRDSFLPPLDSPSAYHQMWSPGWQPRAHSPHRALLDPCHSSLGLPWALSWHGTMCLEPGLWARISRVWKAACRILATGKPQQDGGSQVIWLTDLHCSFNKASTEEQMEAIMAPKQMWTPNQMWQRL